MPRKHSTLSLAECCYRKIAKTMDAFWLRDLSNIADIPRILYVIGPFENMTNKVVQSLLTALVTTGCIQRRHFSCILQESVVQLDLSGTGPAANHDSVLTTVMNRCFKLTSINLQGLNSISGRCLSDFIQQRGPSLKVLKIKSTNCNDQVLSVIGHICKDLLELDISNTKCSNSGALSLCLAFKSEMGCKKLRKLLIFATMINVEGALHCLQNLPHLQYLGFDDVCSVIEQDLLQQEADGHKKYALKSLIANGLRVADVSNESIILSCNSCPELSEARLFCGVRDDNISALACLKHLTSLGIGNRDTSELAFESGLLPVLKQIGQQLLELTLADVNDFDFILIGQHCKQLQKLSILLSGSVSDSLPLSDISAWQHQAGGNLFKKLTQLTVGFPMGVEHGQKAGLIQTLKNATRLLYLDIQYMQSLTTETMLEVLTHNPLKDLQQLRLVYCDSIGPEVIEHLLHTDNDLKELNLEHCKHITLRDFENFQKIVRKNWFALKIKWV